MSPKRLLVLVLAALALSLLWFFHDPSVETDPAPHPDARSSRTKVDADHEEGAEAAVTGSAAKGKTADAAADRREIVENDERLPGLIGRILDDEGQPVRHARVICRDVPSLDDVSTSQLPNMADAKRMMRAADAAKKAQSEASTDEDGRFHLAAPDGDGGLSCEVRARGYLVLDRSSGRPVTTDVDLGDLIIQRAAVIAGRVVDASNAPIAGARVRRSKGGFGESFADMEIAGIGDLAGNGRDGVRTDEDGRFELGHAKPGRFRLRATHAAHPPVSIPARSIAAGEVIEDVVIVMTAGAQIRGRVTDLPRGTTGIRVLARGKTKQSNPLAMLGFDATDLMGSMGLAMGDRTTVAEPDGTFVLTGLKPDQTYKVWAVREGAGVMQMNPCTDPTEVLGGARGVQLRYVGGVAVTMVVVDSRTNAPLTDLMVTPKLVGNSLFGAAIAQAMGSRARFSSYPDGRVTLTNLRPKKNQTLDLEVEAIGYAPFERKTIALPARGKLDLGTVRLVEAPVLRVLVTDNRTGKPVRGADVRLTVDRGEKPAVGIRSRVRVDLDDRVDIRDLGGKQRHGQTDAAGVCLLNSFPGARVAVCVAAKGLAEYRSAPFATSPNKDAEHAVALLLGGSIEVVVLDTEKNPMPEIAVERRGPDDRQTRSSDANGIVRFEHLAPGAYRVRLSEKPAGGGGHSLRIGFSFGTGSTGQDKTAEDAGWKEIDVFDEKTSHVTLKRIGFGRLTGIVRENGVPLRGAKVRFVEGAKNGGEELSTLTEQLEGMLGGDTLNSSPTSRSGRYKLPEVPVGDHRLRITHKDRVMPTLVPVRIELGENTFDVNLVTTSLAGRVIDPGGDPIDGATVEITASASNMAADAKEMMRGATAMFGGGMGLKIGGEEVKTDDDGRFQLRGLRADTLLVLRVRASGFTRSATPVTLRAGETRTGFEVHLSAGGKIRVTVSGKAPLLGAVSATFIEGTGKVAPTMGMLKNGRCTLKSLRPGRWKVTLSSAGDGHGEPRTKEVVVTPGETARVDFEG